MARHHLFGSRASLWFVLDSRVTGKTHILAVYGPRPGCWLRSFCKALLSSANNCPNIKYACGVIPGWYLVVVTLSWCGTPFKVTHLHGDTTRTPYDNLLLLMSKDDLTYTLVWTSKLAIYPSNFEPIQVIHFWTEGPELRNLRGPPTKKKSYPYLVDDTIELKLGMLQIVDFNYCITLEKMPQMPVKGKPCTYPYKTHVLTQALSKCSGSKTYACQCQESPSQWIQSISKISKCESFWFFHIQWNLTATILPCPAI